ncbi:hypothetical protein [Caudoviricetes sp.]|nr:hypothetical protein [Caudoviricetes sp.]
MYDDFDTIHEQQQQEAENRKVQLATVFEYMINQPEGRRFLFGLLNMCSVLGESTFASCPRVQAYMEGKREIGAYVFKTLENTVPTLLYKMLLECKLSSSDQFNILNNGAKNG